MSHNDSILNILGIKDKNIKIISVEEAEHNDDSVKEYITLITATLSYPINRCRNCGFPTVNKDGFRKTHVRLASLNGRVTVAFPQLIRMAFAKLMYDWQV